MLSGRQSLFTRHQPTRPKHLPVLLNKSFQRLIIYEYLYPGAEIDNGVYYSLWQRRSKEGGVELVC